MLSIIPFALLIIFNLFIYCLIKRKRPNQARSSSREKRDLRVASILILIILVYVGCHGIITYINVIELLAIIQGGNKQLKNLLQALFSWQVLTTPSYGVRRWISWSQYLTSSLLSAAPLILQYTASWSVHIHQIKLYQKVLNFRHTEKPTALYLCWFGWVWKLAYDVGWLCVGVSNALCSVVRQCTIILVIQS